MNAKRRLLPALLSLIIVVAISGTFVALRVKSEITDLFRLNRSLQEDGYYMAEFEFQLLGFAYLLDKGEYLHAFDRMRDYHHRLATRQGLVKLPEFGSVQQEIDFYLGLQNPRTGAFMDASAPFCTYYSVTENIISHIDALCRSIGKRVSLRYPLSFLDRINTPGTLVAYLNDISYVGRLGARFPQTSFHFARDILSNTMPDNVIVRNRLYDFSPEWKHTLLQWMYDFQDAATGLWGPKDRESRRLVKADVSNTYSIVKKYRDGDSQDIHPEFPLRHEEQLFNSVLLQLSRPMPDVDDLSAIHEYNLQQAKGIKLLLSRLWANASAKNKAAAKKVIENFIVASFTYYYVPQEGAFSYYPHAEHASVDGMNNMVLDRVGALSFERQTRYWGAPADNARDLGSIVVKEITPKALEAAKNIPDINAWRIYSAPPDYTALRNHVCFLYYPHDTKVLDVAELIPNISHWADTSSLSTGNWKSMAYIRNQYASLVAEKPPVMKKAFPFHEVNGMLRDTGNVYVLGFDILQIPRFVIRYQLP